MAVPTAPAIAGLPAWAEFGDPDGIPLLYHHGMPGAHPEAALWDNEARIQGYRLIVPDRPGIGLTPPRELNSLVDLVDPYCRLLDQLEIASCHQVGWSSGGPLALAMAARAPERVSAVTVIGSYTHFQEAGPQRALLQPEFRHTAFVNGSWARKLSPIVKVIGWTGLWLPGAYLRFLTRLVSVPDRLLLEQPTIRHQFMAAQQLAFRQGFSGARQDLQLQYQDWGFRLAEVAAPVTVFHGQEDALVAPAHGEDLAVRLPRGTLRMLPGKGHFFSLGRDFQESWLRGLE